VNGEPASVVELENDDLEEIRRSIGSEEERATRFAASFLKRVAGERVLDGVGDVLISDPVLTG
jgi:hypothetical protein